MIKFTDIGQFRNVIKEVKLNHDYKGKDDLNEPIYNHDSPYPVLKFRGTIKLHGTNSAIVKYKDRIEFQSRERVLSLTEDNAGFMMAMKNKSIEKLFESIEFQNNCAVFGEWCGGSIQKSVGLNQLPKMFVIFAVKIDGIYQDMENYKNLKIEEEQIYNILQFDHFYQDINFENPELIQNELIQKTIAVETQCPVAKYFGVDGIGEGIVWEYINNDKRYIFKVKGEKHQNSKVKTLTTVNVEEVENINNFIEYSCTENRLSQGIDKMRELGKVIDEKCIGDYLRWIFNDIIKEENDTIIKNQIDVKKLGKYISNKARIFYLNQLNRNI